MDTGQDYASVGILSTATVRPRKVPQQERQRVRRACEGCRKKKIKCNGEEPCQRCLSYSVDCEYAEYVPPHRAVDISNVEQLETRMTSMEQLFRQFLEQFSGEKLASNANIKPAVATIPAAERSQTLISIETIDGLDEPDCDDGDDDDVHVSALNELGDVEPPPNLSHSYADGFGELDTDNCGQLRYLGIGSTATVVDTCVGLRRRIQEGLDKKGYEAEEPFFTSPGATPETTSHKLQSLIVNNMPPGILVGVLIDTFVDNLHFVFPIISPDELRSIHRRILSNEVVGEGSAAILFAVLAMSFLLLPPTHRVLVSVEPKYQKRAFASSMYTLSLHLINSASTAVIGKNNKLSESVVALGMLSSYLATTGMQAEAWIMVGRAIRHAQDLGLHRSPERLQLPTNERSQRRYIWWCLYVLDRQLSAALGRPLSIDDADCDVEIPSYANDGILVQETGGFISLIHIHKIMGEILRTVNSIKNIISWREVGKYEELRARVCTSNLALQNWAREHVPHEIRSANEGKALIEKHIALSAFFSAVLLLHRIFMSNPHRPSPLSDPQAQVRCAKAAMDCIRGSSDFLQYVPRSHYLVFHGQYVFVSAIVLLQFVRASKDSAYNELAFQDIQSAMMTLQKMEALWTGAKKCRAVVEEYMEFTYQVLRGDQKGACNFEHSRGPSTTIIRDNLDKTVVPLIPTSTAVRGVSKKRRREHSHLTSCSHNVSIRSKARDTCAKSTLAMQDQGHVCSGHILETLSSPDHSLQDLNGTEYFDNIIQDGHEVLEDALFSCEPYFQDFEFDFSSTDLSSFFDN